MYWLLKLLLFLFSKLPLRYLQRFAGGMGVLAWCILPSRRRVAIINAGIVGVDDKERVAKESFKHTFRSYLEISHISNVAQDTFFEKVPVTVQGMEYYQQLLEDKCDFALISAHIGGWDMAPAIFSKVLNTKSVIVGRENNSVAINRIMADMRNSFSDIIYVDAKGFLEKAQYYKREGYRTGSLLDHSTTASDSVIAPFFGYRARTLAGIPAISVRNKSPMLPIYLIRDGEGKFMVVIHPPIYPNNTLPIKERIVDMCTKMNREYESIIKQYPEQWYLLHKRFKKVEDPDGTISERIYRP